MDFRPPVGVIGGALQFMESTTSLPQLQPNASQSSIATYASKRNSREKSKQKPTSLEIEPGEHVKPYISKVNELEEKERARAMEVMGDIERMWKQDGPRGELRMGLRRLTWKYREDKLRVEGDMPGQRKESMSTVATDSKRGSLDSAKNKRDSRDKRESAGSAPGKSKQKSDGISEMTEIPRSKIFHIPKTVSSISTKSPTAATFSSELAEPAATKEGPSSPKQLPLHYFEQLAVRGSKDLPTPLNLALPSESSMTPTSTSPSEPRDRSLSLKSRSIPSRPALPAEWVSSSAVPLVASQQRERRPTLREIVTANALPTPQAHSSPIGRETLRDIAYQYTAGPSPPLTPGTPGNAFSGYGFWAKGASESSTPATATFSPILPQKGYEITAPTEERAKEAYDNVQRALQQCARTIAVAGRIDIEELASNDTLMRVVDEEIKPKHEALAARIVLKVLQQEYDETQDRRHTRAPSDLAQMSKILNDEEKRIVDTYVIKSESELLDLDRWLDVDDDITQFVTHLDYLRESLKMLRERRKSRELYLSAQALEIAWAERILQEKEEKAQRTGDDEDSSDDGYTYENMLRSIRPETTEEKRLSATKGTIEAENLSIIPESEEASEEAGLRAINKTTTTSRQASKEQKDFPKDATHRLSFERQDERVMRRQAPNFDDLDFWATELKRLNSAKHKKQGSGSASSSHWRIPSQEERDQWNQELERMELNEKQRQRDERQAEEGERLIGLGITGKGEDGGNDWDSSGIGVAL